MKGYDGREQIAHALYFNGWTNYEYPLPSLMTASLTNDPSGVFVDIGANAGVYSLLAKALRPSRGVHAFEPFPPIVDVLTGNVALNPFASGIVVVAMAASDQAGIARLFIPTAEHGLIETSASLSSDFKDQHSEVVEVRTIRLDDYYGSFSERIGIMKVDVEGAEGRLLRGATKVLARDRPIIFCEILPTSRTWDQVRKILSDCDYAIAEIQEDAVNMSVVEVQDVNVDNYILYPRGKTESVRKLASIAHVRCAG
jgi:FkbM family methyltransferase